MEVLQDTYKDTKIGRIPKDWEVTTLYEIRKQSDRYSFTGGPFGSDLKSSDYTDSGVRIIQLGNIGEGSFIDKSKIYTSEEKANQLISCNVYPNDIILAKMAPVARSCKVPSSSLRYVMCSDGIRLAVDTEKVDDNFIFHSLQDRRFRASAERSMVGTTRGRIGLNDLRNLLIPFPPLAEQQKIAAILSSVDEQISTTDKIIEKSKELKKGLMQKLFSEGIGHTEFKDTKIGRIPKDWEVVLMKSVCEIKGGYSFKSNLFKSEGKYQVIRIGNLYGGQLDLNRSPAFIEETDKKYEDFLLKENDLISTMTGTVGKRDFGFIVKIDKEENLFLNQRVCRMRALMINSDFLYFSCSTTQYLDQFFLQATGGTGNQVNIGTTHIGKIKIALPPLPEQQKIAAILSEADAKIEMEQTQKTQLEQLKKGLMQQLLTGEKRVKV